MEFIAATNNPGKMAEMRRILERMGHTVRSQREAGVTLEPEENGTTFAENARIKAAFYQQQTGCACLADDSGLEVEVLGGKPGIFSARFAGFHADDATNNEKLLAELRKAGVESSPADYRCALAFVDVDGTSLVTEGRCDGTVRMVAKGENGFGYDPYFYTEDYPGRTMAEISFEEKDAISHRGKALRAMVEELEERLR